MLEDLLLYLVQENFKDQHVAGCSKHHEIDLES